jgi:hypothetical protein
MSKAVTLWTILLLTAAPVLAQTPAHRAATNLLLNRQTAPNASGRLAADQFSSEQAAKGHCPGERIVWANLGGSKAYHTSGDRYYGKSKHGAFMCQRDADQSGFHASASHVSKAAKNTHTEATK